MPQLTSPIPAIPTNTTPALQNANFLPSYSNLAPRAVRITNPMDRFKGPLPLPPSVYVDGVLEGGAALGTAYLGSLRLLEQNGIWFKRIAGNSAGAITAALIAVGYTAGEIEWLCSAYPNPPARPKGVFKELFPIDFIEFLDFPELGTIGNDARRNTLLWWAVKGQVIDDILKQPIPLIPTRKKTVDGIVAGLKTNPVIGGAINGSVEDFVCKVVDGSLSFLPKSTPKLKDFRLFDDEKLRIAIADAVWSAVASVDPILLMSTQLFNEGSLFEGRDFYDTMKRLLGAKKHNNPDADVLFEQLEIPLAVIGANIRTRRMEVYSSKTHPTMIVAEAVRRSMSLPLIFEAQGNTVVDGGIAANFPAWLYSSAGDKYWPTASIDANRPKIGFTLDEAAKPPSQWGVSNGKFLLSGTPPSVPLMNVLPPLIIAKLRKMGLYTPSVSLPEQVLETRIKGMKLIEVAYGSATMNREEAVQDIILKALFTNTPYFHVNIPLLGYHGFDFAINNDKDDMEGIAERGWFAARDALSKHPTSGSALISNPNALKNPY